MKPILATRASATREDGRNGANARHRTLFALEQNRRNQRAVTDVTCKY